MSGCDVVDEMMLMGLLMMGLLMMSLSLVRLCGLCPFRFLAFWESSPCCSSRWDFFLDRFFWATKVPFSLALYHGAYFTVIMEWRYLIGCCVYCPVPIFCPTILPFPKIRPSVNRFLLFLVFLFLVDGDDGNDGDDGDNDDGNNGEKST